MTNQTDERTHTVPSTPTPEVVEAFPAKTRAKKYPLETWFDGKIHRLVRGRDFDIKADSMKTTLYNAASQDFGLKVKIQWETEQGQTVAYVQTLGPKTERPVKRKPAKATAKPKAKAKSTKA
jgi:hypothetical protein